MRAKVPWAEAAPRTLRDRRLGRETEAAAAAGQGAAPSRPRETSASEGARTGLGAAGGSGNLGDPGEWGDGTGAFRSRDPGGAVRGGDVLATTEGASSPRPSTPPPGGQGVSGDITGADYSLVRAALRPPLTGPPQPRRQPRSPRPSHPRRRPRASPAGKFGSTLTPCPFHLSAGPGRPRRSRQRRTFEHSPGAPSVTGADSGEGARPPLVGSDRDPGAHCLEPRVGGRPSGRRDLGD